MHDTLDIYCERTAPGLAEEPLNALTNLAFVLAAVLLARSYARVYPARPWQGWDLMLLIALLAAIGVGSGLWHLTAQRWAMWLDVLPILAFISVFLLVSLRRAAGLGWATTLALFLLYHAVNTGVQRALPPDTLNGSIFYLPTFMALILLTGWLAHRRWPGWRDFAAAVTLFVLSLTLRTVDLAWCDVWPVGTHFLWHLLNAWLLYLLVAALIRAPTKLAPP